MIKQKGMIFSRQIVFNVGGLALDLGTVRCFNQFDSETNTLAYFAAVQVTMKKYIKEKKFENINACGQFCKKLQNCNLRKTDSKLVSFLLSVTITLANRNTLA